MPPYSQATRPMRVETVLGEDVLLLAGLHGLEAVSEPYGFQLELLSEDSSLDADKLVRSPVLVTIHLPNGEERKLHGLISRFFQLNQREELTSYRAEVVPWLWFLSLSQDCKIFQNLSVLEIVEQVFKDQGYSDFQNKCTRSYPKREFCVQYRETHLNFVSRLLEEEGIFYFFEHSDSKHVLVLADNSSSVQPCLGPATTRMAAEAEPDEDVVTDLYREHSAYIGTVTLKDYDPLQPSLKLESTISGNGREEIYEYHPGRFTSLEEGERYARLQLEAAEAVRQTVRGASTCRAFQAGCTFELTDHYRADMNQEYALLRVQHFAVAGDFRSWDSAPFDYKNDFLAIPAEVHYRPLRKTDKPVVHGSQTALVVGKPGEEVWVDKHGRIKVQFYWDRDGKKDENTSCWVRVATPWGGKGYGGVSIPRVGNEVIVDFLEGDPDRPIITGSVYNAEQTPPFDLPGSGIQMGMKSRSSPGGGGTNEITMSDTKGKEKVNIHAQYDMSTTVLHDDTQTVKNDRTITVDGKHTETIKKDTSITVTEGKLNHDVAAGTATYHVNGAVVENFDATQATTVDSDVTLISKNGAITIAADSQHIYIKGTTSIQIRVGPSMIWMDSGGQIGIEGVNVSINGSSSVTIKGGTVHSEADSQHQTKGAIVLSEGSATNTVKGGMV
ncbi:MAG: type VI secretion system tip protein VgrG, partial [Gemmatimonadetes bacterium]|nr:type VI secretion system tip protein VgrG [Gemmatimonadota bacterium]